jgi:hypothetical protein
MDQREHADDLGSLRHAMEDDGELYGWMRVRYASFRALLAESRRPNWMRIAAGLAQLGVLDGRGHPPTAATARQTWWKVRRDIAARSNRSGPANHDADAQLDREPQQAAGHIPNPSAHRPAGPPGEFDPNDIAADDMAEPAFRPATPRNWSPTPEPRRATAANTTNPHDGQDYAEALRRLTERARARSLPMPDVPTAEDE